MYIFCVCSNTLRPTQSITSQLTHSLDFQPHKHIHSNLTTPMHHVHNGYIQNSYHRLNSPTPHVSIRQITAPSNLCLILKHFDKDWKTIILTNSQSWAPHTASITFSQQLATFCSHPPFPSYVLQHSPESQNCLPSITLHHSSIPPNITAIFLTNASIIKSLQN
jgi:hypothetical protein